MSIKKIIPLHIKQYLKSFTQPTNINGDLHTHKPKVFIGLAADYGNLGDVAISYAQYEFLKNNLPDFEVIDVPISRTLTNIRAIKKVIKPHDIITLVGGGNLTNHYQDIEDLRQKWVASFPANKVISFPQTIDFSSDAAGNKAQAIAFANYSKHKHLTFFAREDISFDRLSKVASNNVVYCPDIVLSLDKTNRDIERHGVLSCIRSDGESNLSSAEKSDLLKTLKNQYNGSIRFGDTHIDNSNMSWEVRLAELENIWQRFRSAKVIVTDRLHGMIFAAITGSPCVVLTNSNHKIKQTYLNWLSHLPHIVLVEREDVSNVPGKVAQLMTTEENCALPNLARHYQPLIDELLK